MNQISAAEAQRLCHAVMDQGDDAHAFPKHIAARDFLECLRLYGEMRRAGVINRPLRSGKHAMPSVRKRSREVEELDRPRGMSEDSQTLTEKDLESLNLSPKEQQIIGLVRENRDIRDKDIAAILHIGLPPGEHIQEIGC